MKKKIIIVLIVLVGIAVAIWFFTKSKMTPEKLVMSKKWVKQNGTIGNPEIAKVTPDGTVFNVSPNWVGKLVDANTIQWQASTGEMATWVAAV